MKFDESNGSQVEQLPIDVGDKDPSKAIKDLSIDKISPTEVKENTSSIQVEASTSRQGEPSGLRPHGGRGPSRVPGRTAGEQASRSVEARALERAHRRHAGRRA